MKANPFYPFVVATFLMPFLFPFIGCDKPNNLSTETEKKTEDSSIDQGIVGFWWNASYPYGMEVKTDGLTCMLEYDTSGNIIYGYTSMNTQFISAVRDTGAPTESGAFTMRIWNSTSDTVRTGDYWLGDNDSTFTYSFRDADSQYIGNPLTWKKTSLGAHAPNIGLTVSPSSLTIIARKTGTATISNGTQPYDVYSNSNAAIATASFSGSTMTINALTEGYTTIQIKDAAAQVKYIRLFVNVTASSMRITFSPPAMSFNDLYTVTTTISGGTPPYIIDSYSQWSNVSATISESTMTITPIRRGGGGTTIQVRDNWSPYIYGSFFANVSNTYPMLTVSPILLSVPAGQSGTATLSGGRTPYHIYTNSTPGVASVSLTGSTVTINAMSLGSTSIQLNDNNSPAKYTTLSVTVTR